MTDKTLFVRVGGDQHWTQDEMDQLIEGIDSITDEGIEIIATPDDVEYLSPDQVEEFAQELIEALPEDE